VGTIDFVDREHDPRTGRSALATAGLPDRERIAVWSQFLQAHTLVIRTLEQELIADQDLTLAEYDVLVHLSQAPGNRLRMSELGALLLVTSGGATKLIDRMTKRGLTDRELDPDDRRVVYAVFTPAGRQKLRLAARIHLAGVHRYFTSLMPAEEIEPLRSFFSRILSGNEGHGTPPAITPDGSA
jgi:DNA-binding MarR family transcriptional regulator